MADEDCAKIGLRSRNPQLAGASAVPPGISPQLVRQIREGSARPLLELKPQLKATYHKPPKGRAARYRSGRSHTQRVDCSIHVRKAAGGGGREKRDGVHVLRAHSLRWQR